MLNFANLTFKKACVHSVQPREKGQSETLVIYDEDLTDIPEYSADKIKKKLNDAFNTQTKSFELDIIRQEEGSFFSLAKSLRACNANECVNVSKNMAKKLADSQTGGIPGGFFILIDAIDEKANPVIIVIKAELTNALKSNKVNGITSIEVIDNLFLGDSDKFYKIGVLFKRPFPIPDKSEPNDLWGFYLFDDQFRPGSRPAEYFWSNFLGLTLNNNGKLQTYEYHEAIKQFASKVYSHDYEKQTNVLNAVETFIKESKTEFIDPALIKDTFIEKAHELEYSELVGEKFPNRFEKDLSLINRKISRQNITFGESKISLSGPKEAFQDGVRILKDPNELYDYNLKDPNLTFVVLKGKPHKK